MATPKLVTMDEIRQHKTRESFWLLLHGKVYDATSFLDEHPGGDEVVLAEAGQDGTDAFEDVGHSDEARAMLPDMLVGDYDPTVPPTATEETKTSAGSSKPIPDNVVKKGSDMMYFLPLSLLGAYFAYRFYF